MKRAKVWVAATATGAVLAALLTSPVLAPVAAAPGDPQRIAFTDDRDELQQVTVFSESDGYTEDLTPGDRVTSAEFRDYELGPDHEGEFSGTETGGGAFVSTRGDDLDGEVFFSEPTDPESEEPPRTFQVTCDNSDVETHPVVRQGSPWTVAFASDVAEEEDGDWDIYVAVENSEAEGGDGLCEGWQLIRVPEVAAAGQGNDLWPAWTPDGDELVFSSTTVDPLGDLYRITYDDIEVETPEQLTDDPAADTQPAVMTLDNNEQAEDWIAFTTTRYRIDGSVALMPLDGTDSSVVNAFTTNERATRQSSEPAWGGDEFRPYLAYSTTEDDPAGDVWVASVTRPDGTEPERVPPGILDQGAAADAPGVTESHPAWFTEFSPMSEDPRDQAQLLFTSTPVDDDDLDDVVIPGEPPNGYGYPGTPDVVVPPHLMEADIGDAVAADGTDRRVVVDEQQPDGDEPDFRADETTPDYSPEGEIVFSSDLPGSANDEGRRLMLADSDGGNVRPLEYERGSDDIDAEPVWSPDGSQIAFTRYESDGDGGNIVPVVRVVTLDAAGDQASQRTVSVAPSNVRIEDEGPDWSPDGEQIVLSRRENPIVPLARRPPSAPDDGFSSLWVVPAAGGSPGVPLRYPVGRCPADPCTGESVPGRTPAWSPDGSRIAYQRGGAIRTIRLAVDAAGDPLLTSIQDGPAVTGFEGRDQEGEATPSRPQISWAADPAWSPDGTEIAFTGQPAGQPNLRGIYAISPEGTGLRLVTDERGPETEPAWSPVQGTDVAVTVTVSGSPAAPGDPVTATYTVTNLGTARAQDVVLGTSFTAGGTKTATTPPSGCSTNGTGCSFGTLAPGDTRQYVVRLTYPSARDGVAAGTVSTTSEDLDLTNNKDSAPFRIGSVDVSVDVRLVSEAPPLNGSRAWVGGSRTLQVDVRNAGPEPASAVTVALTYPTDLVTPGSLDPCRNGVAPCALGTLAADELRSFDVPLTMKKDGAAVIAAKVATPDFDSRPANNADSVSLKVIQPTVRLLPAVARPGMVTMAFGEKMPPGSRVTMAWDPGITVNTGPFKVAADGTVRAHLLIVRHDRLGSRLILANSTKALFSEVEGPMLVANRLAMAPGFLGRG